MVEDLKKLLENPPPVCEMNTTLLLEGYEILITAPHAVSHARHAAPSTNRERKPHDAATGQIAELLATNSVATALVARQPWSGNANADPLEVCLFKKRVVDLIKAGTVHTVLDLHGMSRQHGLDVCIGVGNDTTNSAATTLTGLFRDAGLSIGLNKPYAGRGPGTVRTAASMAGATAVQLEIGPWCRSPENHPERTSALLDALMTFIGLSTR